MYWKDRKFVGEADGRLKYDSPERIYREKLRQDALQSMHLGFERWGWHEAYVDRTLMLRKLRPHLRNAPCEMCGHGVKGDRG